MVTIATHSNSMYILLRGQVTIFIQYTTKPVHQTISEPVQKTSSSRRQSSKVNAPAKSPQGQDITGTPESLGEIGIRKLLGTYVCSLGLYIDRCVYTYLLTHSYIFITTVVLYIMYRFRLIIQLQLFLYNAYF